MNKRFYTVPLCETEVYKLQDLLASSDLTDDGAGDYLTDGGEFEF